MRSISTTRGDGGETRSRRRHSRLEGVAPRGGVGTVDELNTALGFARAICEDAEVREMSKRIQSELFTVCSALATPPESPKPQVPITSEMVDALTAAVHRFEAIDGVLADWSVSGDLERAFDVARTVCRRAERCVVRFAEAGERSRLDLPYLNRLSDLLWIIARKLERDAGVSGSLREMTGKAGNRVLTRMVRRAFAATARRASQHARRWRSHANRSRVSFRRCRAPRRCSSPSVLAIASSGCRISAVIRPR